MFSWISYVRFVMIASSVSLLKSLQFESIFVSTAAPQKISGARLAMARGHLLLVNTANLLAKPQRQ
jgi:hypothetical protein